MSATLIFWLSFIVLIGLQLCVPEKISDANGTYKDELAEKYWTDNNWLRILYGWSVLLGSLSVIAAAGYLTFAEHWWYILVYIGAIIGSKIGAFILKLGLVVILPPMYMYDRLKICRIVGLIIIYVALIMGFLLS